MKITALLMLAASLHVFAGARSQNVTILADGEPLAKVFGRIEAQTGYFFVYTMEMLEAAGRVNVRIENRPLTSALDLLFRDSRLTYVFNNRFVVIKFRPVDKADSAQLEMAVPVSVHGTVAGENGQPISGVSVFIKNTRNGTTTDADGHFTLIAEPGQLLVFSSIGFETREVKVTAQMNTLKIVLLAKVSPLDESVIIAYGTTTRRLNTGSVVSVSAEDIARQPVSNPLSALEGRVPGLGITQYDGLPGGWFDVSIRGKNSIENSSRPLFLVDGVPFSNESMGSFPGTNYYNSPLNTINPGEIESIEILKDADATAIYGSRGANGVIMITTKKGKAGKTRLEGNVYSGFTKATSLVKMMDTKQYVAMRREAFANDGIEPTPLNAPDLTVWDTTRYTNWQKELIGGSARSSDAQLSTSGGNTNAQFRIGAGFHHETPLYSKDMSYNRGSLDMNLTFKTPDNKASVSLSGSFSHDASNFSQNTFTFNDVPPNAPYPYDNKGALVWSEGGASFNNPFATLLSTYKAKNNKLTSNLNIRLHPIRDLEFKVVGGYNTVSYRDVQSTPLAATDPANNFGNYSYFNNTQTFSWSLEPTIAYKHHFGKGQLEILAGSSWQQATNEGTRINASGYSSDELLGSVAGASDITTQISSSDYRYQALYGRLNYNIDNKYILNLTGRRDGSSRFGPGRQYGSFGAAGGAWIFSSENWMAWSKKVLSFGKLRASYGTTGSDNIGDYQYLDTWRNVYSSSSYDGHIGLTPSRLFNSDYAWEVNKKAEFAIELGFLQDRILITANYYSNTSTNQLISYKLPAQTGFSNVLQNFPAKVRNSGLEMMISTVNIKTPQFTWETKINLTHSTNKLLSFPGFETSSYASYLALGYPLNIFKSYVYQGVDPSTGYYSFAGTDQDDRTAITAYTPSVYGGIGNNFRYKGFELDVFFQFVKNKNQDQITYNYDIPGNMYNQPAALLNRWQKPGDKATIQRYTTLSSGDAVTAFYNLQNSNGVITDMSFIRLKNISLSYSLPDKFIKQLHMTALRIYFQGQNLAVFSKFKGGDPESTGIGNPLLKIFTAGLQFNF